MCHQVWPGPHLKRSPAVTEMNLLASCQLSLSKIEPVHRLCRCVQMKTDDSFWDRNWLKGSFVKSSNLAEQRTSAAVWVSNNS